MVLQLTVFCLWRWQPAVSHSRSLRRGMCTYVALRSPHPALFSAGVGTAMGGLATERRARNSRRCLPVEGLLFGPVFDPSVPNTPAITAGYLSYVWSRRIALRRLHGLPGGRTATALSETAQCPDQFLTRGRSDWRARVAAAVTAGELHSCGIAVSPPGAAFCWGYNAYGQLGDGTTSDRSVPVAVASGSVIFSTIAAGEIHSCGLAVSPL